MERNEKKIIQKYGLEKTGKSFTPDVLNKIEALEEKALCRIVTQSTVSAPESLSAKIMQSIGTLEQPTESAKTYRPIGKIAAVYVPLALFVVFNIFLFVSVYTLPESSLSSDISSYANYLDSLMSALKTNSSTYALSILCALGLFSMLLLDGLLKGKKPISLTS